MAAVSATLGVIGPGLLGAVSPAWAMVLAGGGFGFGVWLVLLGLVPRRPRLSAVLAAALAPPVAGLSFSSGEHRHGAPDQAGVRGWVRWALPPARLLRRAGLPGRRTEADLRVAGRPVLVHLATKVTTAVAGLGAPVLLAVPLAGSEQAWWPLWLCLLGAAVGFLLPDLQVQSVARRRRAELRRAVGTVLDLTAVALAGGAGVEQALTGAAAVGAGWAPEQLRAALDAARTTRTDPWAALGRLGTDLGVVELSELAATLLLAGSEGARVRASLTAKAAGLRAHQQTEAEAAAASATERMSLPVIVLFAGYLIFIGYPALAKVLTSL